MIGILALLAMALFPGLVWAGLLCWAPQRKILRLAGASIVAPVVLVSAILLDFVVNRTPQDKFAALTTYALIFMIELLLSIGIAGCCEAWLERTRKRA